MCRYSIKMSVLVVVLIDSYKLFMSVQHVFGKATYMFQWQWVSNNERVDSQWQKVNGGI